MTDETPSKNWKLELRYGRLVTPYSHFTVIADGCVGELEHGFECPPGPAFMAMKAWARDTQQATDMAAAIGAQIGFAVSGRTQVYDTEPELPPREDAYGYGINFTPYAAE